MKSPFCVLIVFVFLAACSTPKEKIPDVNPMQTTSQKIIVYQMMTRLFGNQNTTNKPYGTIEENGVGNLLI
jgi:uncharacterized lipoprotein YajG